jgi:hypothetical protein
MPFAAAANTVNLSSIRPVLIPVYYAAQLSRPAAATQASGILPRSRGLFYGDVGPLDPWSMSRLASSSAPAPATGGPNRGAEPPPPAPPLQPRLDRLQLATWALLRAQETGIAGSRPLASGGQLGASQAGMRLIHNVTRQLAASARLSTEVGRRGGEVAAGVRVRPLVNIPVWLTAERRQRIGQYGGGRNAFAVFAEGGVYGMHLPARFTMNGYLQGGVVGARHRDLFIDGGVAVTRPVYRQFSGGLGVWGAAQPGISRLDIGPRVTMRVRGRYNVHVDWRQKLLGNARPGSGPALTLSGDF